MSLRQVDLGNDQTAYLQYAHKYAPLLGRERNEDIWGFDQGIGSIDTAQRVSGRAVRFEAEYLGTQTTLVAETGN